MTQLKPKDKVKIVLYGNLEFVSGEYIDTHQHLVGQSATVKSAYFKNNLERYTLYGVVGGVESYTLEQLRFKSRGYERKK